jgi:serine/threonine-protein kinase
VEAYERALALDPAYAPAWAALGIPLCYLAEGASTPAAVDAQRRRALAAAERAVALSPELPDALSTRGILRALIDYDWAGGKADLERAIELEPHDPDSRRRYAVLLQDLGRLPEAIVEARKAVDLDPLGQSWITLGTLHQAAGDLAESEAAFRRFLQIAPGNPASSIGLARTLLLRSKPKDALALFESVPEEDYRLWGKAAAEHALGHPEASSEALAALTSKYAHTSALLVAEAHAWRGEKEAAFLWMERAVAQPGGVGAAFRTSPFFRILRDDPRHAVLLRKMKLPVDQTSR